MYRVRSSLTYSAHGIRPAAAVGYRTMFKRIISLLLCFSICGCSLAAAPATQPFPTIDKQNLPVPATETVIRYLSNCTHPEDQILEFNPDEPMIVLVHGCNGSVGKFLALANVLAFHGQQTVCFSYDDRDSMMTSSAQLVEALQQLVDHMNSPELTVIAHSQGGLIARKALIQERPEAVKWNHDLTIRLITISSPFAGIEASKHCASTVSLVFSFGLTIPVCQLISGDKWYEITHASDFIQYPGALVDPVTGYLKIVTDERGNCLYEDEKGECLEDDYLFSLEEQYFQKVDSDPNLTNIEVKAGHSEIVGDENIIPIKLITILQEQGIMKPTPPEAQRELAQVLRDLY